MNERTKREAKNANNIARGVAPFMIQKKYVGLLEENHNHLLPRYEGFDVVTRRYLDYCQHSGASIEEYIVGIKESDLVVTTAGLQESRSFSPELRLTTRQGTTKE